MKKFSISLCLLCIGVGLSSSGYPNSLKLSLVTSYTGDTTKDNVNHKHHTFLIAENTCSWPSTFLGLTLNPGAKISISTYYNSFHNGQIIINGDANYYGSDASKLGTTSLMQNIFIDSVEQQTLSTYILNMSVNGMSTIVNSSQACCAIWNNACALSGNQNYAFNTLSIYPTNYLFPWFVATQMVYNGNTTDVALPGVQNSKYYRDSAGNNWVSF